MLEKGGAGGPAKGLAPAHFFPLEGPVYFCWDCLLFDYIKHVYSLYRLFIETLQQDTLSMKHPDDCSI